MTNDCSYEMSVYASVQNANRIIAKATDVEATSNMRMVLSRLALMICRSPGINLTLDTVCSCPGKVFEFFHSCSVSHSLTRRSDDPVTAVKIMSDKRRASVSIAQLT